MKRHSKWKQRTLRVGPEYSSGGAGLVMLSHAALLVGVYVTACCAEELVWEQKEWYTDAPAGQALHDIDARSVPGTALLRRQEDGAYANQGEIVSAPIDLGGRVQVEGLQIQACEYADTFANVLGDNAAENWAYTSGRWHVRRGRLRCLGTGEARLRGLRLREFTLTVQSLVENGERLGLGWCHGQNDCHTLLVSGSKLTILRTTNGSARTLSEARSDINWSPGKPLHLELEVKGATLRGRSWTEGNPPDWQVVAEATGLSAGFPALLSQQTTVSFDKVLVKFPEVIGTKVSAQIRAASTRERLRLAPWFAHANTALPAKAQGQWVQYRVQLTTADPQSTPVLRGVSFAYHYLHPADVGRLHGVALGIDLTSEGALRLKQTRSSVFSCDFDQGVKGWEIKNFENALSLSLPLRPGESHSGTTCFYVSRSGGSADTAWELASPPFAVKPGGEYFLSFWVKHDVDLRKQAGCREDYWSELAWLDATGKRVGAEPFGYGGASETWYRVSLDAVPPDGATQARIRFGFDTPDLVGHYFALDDLQLETWSDPPQYESHGELVSAVYDAGRVANFGKLLWEAERPPGAVVTCQVRTAPDVNGVAGKWTAWAGPDGSANTYFKMPGPLSRQQAGHRFAQYRAFLDTADPTKTPVLRRVTLTHDGGEWVNAEWPGVDTEGPNLELKSPQLSSDPQPTLQVRIADANRGGGVDRSTLRVLLDGIDTTDKMNWQGPEEFALRPAAPLQPSFSLQFDQPGAWNTTFNYENALTITRETAEAHEGGTCIKITRLGPRRDTAFVLKSRRVPVVGGATYQLACWIRSNLDLSRISANPGSDNRPFLYWFDAAGQPLPNTELAFSFGPASENWTRQELQAKAPANAAWAVINLGVDGPDLSGGQFVMFDDVEFAGPKPEGVKSTDPNLHKLTVSASDLAGNISTRSWWLVVRDLPKVPIATMRSDGVTLVDGKPFFPIGMYAVWKSAINQNDFDRAFVELRDAGFNTAHTYNRNRDADLAAFYEKAKQYGFKVFLAARPGANEKDVDNIIGDVVAEMDQPSLLAWYLADDTAGYVSAAELGGIHRTLRAVDPNHLTVQADAVGSPDASRYAEYVDATDVFLPELYPIRSDQSAVVPRITQDLKTLYADFLRAGHKRPVWAIVQDFQGWGWQRYPTDAEVRCMTYLALIHGATGMTYYTYGCYGENRGAPGNSEVWANLKRIAGELRDLQDVLVEPDADGFFSATIVKGPAQDALHYPSLNALLKEHAGKRWLFAANSAKAEVQARFEIAEAPERISVQFEHRQLTAKDSVWEDTFAPYAVHVYTWE